MAGPKPTPDTVTVASQSIELLLTGKPDVKYKWGSGSIRPSLVAFTYRQEGIRAHLYGVWVREDGEVTDQPCDQAYRIGDTDEWPDWLADLAREHKPAAAPSAPADRGALRGRIAEALAAVLAECDAIEADYRNQHDEVAVGTRAAIIRIRARVAVLEQQPAVLPTPADRAAEWRAAAEHLEQRAAVIADSSDDPAVFVAKARERDAAGWKDAAAELRRMAGEAQQPETQPQLAAYQTCGVCSSGYPTGGSCGGCAFNARMTAEAQQSKTQAEAAAKPNCRDTEGCHRVIPCDPGCGTRWSSTQPGKEV